ncbi:MAG: hypothetical protein PWR29_831 [Methanolobus sp.]|nr:hypothetical protein [Methanolobus sp.]
MIITGGLSLKNELGDEVPSHIEKKANELGCHKGVTYVYREGSYGSSGMPASSIGGKRAHRFGDRISFEANKVKLGDGWVAFRPPSGGGVAVRNNKASTPYLVNNKDPILGDFDNADGLWKSFDEHLQGVTATPVRRKCQEILEVALSCQNKGIQTFSRKDGFSCIIKGLKVAQLHIKPSSFSMKLASYSEKSMSRKVNRLEVKYDFDSDNVDSVVTEDIRQHLLQQSEIILSLRKEGSIGYEEKWLHGLLINKMKEGGLSELGLDFLRYETSLGKIKRNIRFGRMHADILARERSTCSLAVVEVKIRSSEMKEAVVQGLSYVEWLNTYKAQLIPRVNKLDWDVNFEPVKLYVIAPGSSIPLDEINKIIRDYQGRIAGDIYSVLLNADWHINEGLRIMDKRIVHGDF